ncbi:putative F-box/kelch-repeat protein [Raphanus sativus]|uniref:F-box/kelch-repeat protein At3g17540 n=1 Tax=Raphanus sativus TaxID=3726 RepID=A0A9W3DCR1_RAPSA|nr:putative F-box/kelch-repeat protein At3g17540 [Raphanus sativus]KAJ4908454.1 putative F-box/kelch-repeat protein [Raphanus sativus]
MTMISDLPNDMEAEILSRVPAKSLSRLKTTCKRWYALFRDPKFVAKNKKLGRGVRESILLTNHGDVFSVAGDLHNTGVNTPIEVSGKLTSLKGSEDLDFKDIFHCDGLMLCSALGNDRLVVWNPCTGQTRNIKARTSFETNQTYALGYSRSSSSGHSYKILRCFDYQEDQKDWVPRCEIYELRSDDSWRVLDSFPLDYIMFRDGVSLKGNTYWVAKDEESGYFMMKFDFTTERFVRLPLPFQIFYRYDQTVLSVVRDEKLSVIQIYDKSDVRSYVRSYEMRIWVSTKVDEDANKDLSWRSDLVLEVDDDTFFGMYFRSFLLDEENKVAVLCCDIDLVGDNYTTIVYIIGEDMLEQVYSGTIKESRSNSPLVSTYVPSLVCI